MLYTSEEFESDCLSIYKLRIREEITCTEGMMARQTIGKPHHIGLGNREDGAR